jgi:N-acetylneuraminic acid mutarotase
MTTRHKPAIRWTIVFSALVMACGGGGGDGADDGDDGTSPPPPPTPVSSVTITPGPALTLSVGATSQLTATARDQQGNVLTGRDIAWATTAQGIATVSTNGLVTATAVGSAQIRATSEGKVGEVAVTVEALPWTLTGSLTTGRTLHSATLLADGRVLVTGGQAIGTTQSLRSAEVYNPATGTWTSTGDMITGRTNHVAVRLQNGRVLVAGGVSVEQQTRLASAEIYDPSTGTWTATGNLVTARQLAGASLLNDGRVLLFGGSGPNGNFDPLATSELYNPATGQWASAGAMTVPRVGHAAVLLSNGRILASGGATNSISGVVLHASSEVYNPTTGQWTGSGNFLTARSFHATVVLANGRPLIAGGSNYVSTAYGAADVYDPVTGGWTGTGSLLTGRVSHTATRLPNGKVLVAGGTGATGTLGSTELYDAATGTWSAAAPLRVARLNHAAVLLNTGKVLVVGGQGTGASTSAELFDPAVGASVSGRLK